MSFSNYLSLAFLGGILLALMVRLDGALSESTSPLWSSMIAHGVGAFCAIGIVILIKLFMSKKPLEKEPEKAHWLYYFAGVPGALTVILLGVAAASQIGIIGTIALMLLGQVIFSLFVDTFGWMGMRRRTIHAVGLVQVVCVLSGSVLIVFFAR